MGALDATADNRYRIGDWRRGGDYCWLATSYAPLKFKVEYFISKL
jgi:hypothetical protein